MRRPLALDLFCGAGGVSMGLCAAGFDVGGVNIKARRRHPAFHYAPYARSFRFIRADALRPPVNLEDFDFIWASPPCQAFTSLRGMWNAREHPNLIPATRELLEASGRPWCIENVRDAPLGESGRLTMLCGSMFGLRTNDGAAELRRHRYFETSFDLGLTPPCAHRSPVIGVYGGHGRDRRRRVNTQDFSTAARREAMGIEWMSGGELSEAIPPAYATWIGTRALAQ